MDKREIKILQEELKQIPDTEGTRYLARKAEGYRLLDHIVFNQKLEIINLHF